MQKYEQTTRYSSPWSYKYHILRLIFRFVWLILCRLSPKKLNILRVAILRAFGAQIGDNCFISASAIIYYPWHINLADNVCVADFVELYSLNKINLHKGVVISSSCFICTGSHDFNSDKRELLTAEITIGEETFIGSRAIVLMGVNIGANCIIGAGSVVGKSFECDNVIIGNPAKSIRNLKS